MNPCHICGQPATYHAWRTTLEELMSDAKTNEQWWCDDCWLDADMADDEGYGQDKPD